MKTINYLLASMALTGLVGCGSESDELTIPTYAAPTDAICNNVSQDVDWTKVLSANANKLSEYKLFESQCNPTTAPNARGLEYDLSIPLFTDYTSKYRFVFVPEDQKATYSSSDVFDFPVGTVITKTFSMPSTTDKDSRGYAVENILETRLLIRKEIGWVARVYAWDEDKLDATRITGGEFVPSVLGHGEEILEFNYGIPDQSACTECHKVKVTEEETFFTPIGPKARYLNSSYDYATGAENQIEKWISEGLLDGTTVPSAETRPKEKAFNDYLSVEDIPNDELEDVALGWLDINCAHCHSTQGTASNTAFKSSTAEAFQGFCEVPVSGAGTGALVVLPGNAESSLLYQRLNTTEAGMTMPPIGRATIHTSGTALVKRWIDSLTGPICN